MPEIASKHLEIQRQALGVREWLVFLESLDLNIAV